MQTKVTLRPLTVFLPNRSADILKDPRHIALSDCYGNPDMSSRSTSKAGLSRQPNAERQFERFWEEYEESNSELQRPPNVPTCVTAHISRHVDLLEALFSSHRYQMPTKALSPIAPYNEDIAERNMIRPPRKMPTALADVPSSPSLYQEDVADRNIAVGSSSCSSSPRAGSPSSQTTIPKSIRKRWPTPTKGGRVGSQKLPGRKWEETMESETNTQDSPRSTFTCQNENRRTPLMRTAQSSPVIRTDRSASDGISQTATDSTAVDCLGVPSAYNQGGVLSNAPLPDSPTLPLELTYNVNANNEDGDAAQSTPALSRGDSPTASSTTSRASSQLNARKNVRDLSIDTEAAASGRRITRISHRAIQPPTPLDTERQNPSIAEVMNLRLPSQNASPIACHPSIAHAANDMMEAFRLASIPKNTKPMPTCETLQDTIVREINSHEAFQRVPVPDDEPPFAPPASEPAPFDEGSKRRKRTISKSGRGLLAKDNQISKLIGRGAQKKRSRNPEFSGSVTTGNSSTGFRRHTDAPAPSRELLDYTRTTRRTVSDGSTQQVNGPVKKNRRGSSTSVDQRTPSCFGRVKNFDTSSKSSSRGTPESSSTQGSVCYMRAHSEPSPSTDQNSGSPAPDEEDEIIQLPSVGPPGSQFQGVDMNNVAYFTTPDDAYRLMNWPKKRAEPAARRPSTNQCRS